jgi:hypothetical protein
METIELYLQRNLNEKQIPEDDRQTALFIKAQLSKTIFQQHDPLYRNDNHFKDPSLTKQKRSKVTGTKC